MTDDGFPFIVPGTLLSVVAKQARWIGEGHFPSSLEWADEIERVLHFLVSQDQFGKFLPRLQGRARQRDAAFAEARTGFFVARNGFRIVEWEPVAVSRRPGDLAMQWRSERPIFVEVKGPDWQGELTPAERDNGRQYRPKDIEGEARWIDQSASIQQVLHNAPPKLSDDRPNMVVISDDLFVSPLEWPASLRLATQRLTVALRAPAFERVGAMFLLRPICVTAHIEYSTHYIENEAALPECQLPKPVAAGLMANDRR